MPANTPLGGFADPNTTSLPDYRLPIPTSPMTQDLMSQAGNNPNLPTPVQTPLSDAQKSDQSLLKGLMPIQSGLAAGSQVVPTTDALEAAVQAGGSALAGAASGAVAGAAIGAGGGPIGAAIGGGVGLVVGGLNAWLSVRASRKAARQAEAINAEAKRRQDARDKQARDDAINQLSYNRRQAAIQNQWAAQEMARNKFDELLSLDDNLKAKFQKSGL